MNWRADLRQAVVTSSVGEGVPVALEQREVGVHPRALDAESGLGMKLAWTPLLVGDLFDYETDGHHRVGHSQGVGVAQVDLVLARRVLVLGVLNGNAHVL